MKGILIKNGKLQLILTPSDEVEKILLSQLCQTPVELQQFSTLQVGTDSVNDAVLIAPIPKGKEKLFTEADIRKAYYTLSPKEADDTGDVEFLSWLKNKIKP